MRIEPPYDFVSAQDFSLLDEHWLAALELARLGGWSRSGTLPPEGFSGDWIGEYEEPQGQFVESNDAKNFAAALER